MPENSSALMLCCLLWAHPGRAAQMARYEDAVIALLMDHGAEIMQRVASDGADGQPDEVQLYRFPDQRALDDFLADPRRQELASERERVIERTELFPVHSITH
ncbi:DUF1330 domain-containing protein [Microbacterium sp. AGC85]